MFMACRRCEVRHDPLLTCAVAAARRVFEAGAVVVHAKESVVVHAPLVVHAEPPVVVHESTSPPVSAETPIRHLDGTDTAADTLAGGGTKHGKYADAAARNEYRRAWAKADRAKKRAARA